MLVATWNVNGLRARFDFLMIWLRERRPDLVALQELKLTEDQFPYAELRAEGYSAVVHGQKGWNGVAILAKGELSSGITGLPGEAEPEARLVSADFRGLRFVSVYCPNGKSLDHPDYLRKLDWYDRLTGFLGEQFRSTEPVIVGGDFNICASPIDSWNEEMLAGGIFHTDAERERLSRLWQWGLTDVFRHLHPALRCYSWWDYRAGAFYKNEGLRIDLLLASEPALKRVVRAEIDRDFRKKKDGLTASDHAPVLAEIED